MALLGDRVQETTTSTGTGSITLNGAVTGYVTFNSTFSNGNSVWYVIDDGAGNWEIGYGTVGTGTLTRTVFQSSNANALVPFGVGTKRVFCTAPYTYLLPDQTGNSGKILTTDGTTSSWTTIASAGGVTSVSVASANGFAGTSSGGSTPALTLSTSISGILKGNGTAISAAVAGTDYAAANASFTLGSTSVSLGGTTTTVAGLTLTNPTINGFTGDTSVVNIGSGQFYKDTSGNVGIGTSSPSSFTGYTTVSVNNATNGGIYNILVNGTETARLQAYSGIFNVAAKGASTVLTFETNGSERMRLDTSGNVGIGTSSPVTVSGYTLQTINSQTNGSGLYLQYQGTTVGRLLNTSNTMYVGTTGAYPLIFQANSAEAMRLDSSGNLGIGTSSPASKLDVTGEIRIYPSSGAGTLRFGSGGVEKGKLLVDSSGNMGFETAGTQRMTLDSSGNLGIGTSSPGQKLEVSGSAYITGGVGGQGCYLTRNGSDGGAVYSAQVGSIQLSAPSTNPITFVTNSTEKMRLDSSGNLGLGVTPSYRLDVLSGSTGAKMFRFSSSGTSKYMYGYCDGGGTGITNSDPYTSGVMYYQTGSQHQFYTGSTQAMTLDASGNLLVGTTAYEV